MVYNIIWNIDNYGGHYNSYILDFVMAKIIESKSNSIRHSSISDAPFVANNYFVYRINLFSIYTIFDETLFCNNLNSTNLYVFKFNNYSCFQVTCLFIHEVEWCFNYFFVHRSRCINCSITFLFETFNDIKIKIDQTRDINKRRK